MGWLLLSEFVLDGGGVTGSGFGSSLALISTLGFRGFSIGAIAVGRARGPESLVETDAVGIRLRF
jgi:hypothetical protein